MLILFLACIGIGTAGYAAIRGDRLACVVEVLLGAVWLWADKPVEGRILVTLSATHGITLADLFSVACFALAGWGWARSSRRRAREQQERTQERFRASRAGALATPASQRRH